MKTNLSLLAAVLLAAPVSSLAVDYQTEILPILKSQCIKCHGGEEPKGDFSLDPGEIEKHIKSSGAIRPGKAERSDFYKLLISEDEDERMPKEKPAMGAEQIALIKQWIDDGALLVNAEGKDKEKGEADSAEKKPGESAEMPKPVAEAWTNTEGKTIQATLTGVNGDSVMLRLADGRTVPYPMSKLSAESQEKAKKFADALKAGQ